MMKKLLIALSIAALPLSVAIAHQRGTWEAPTATATYKVVAGTIAVVAPGALDVFATSATFTPAITLDGSNGKVTAGSFVGVWAGTAISTIQAGDYQDIKVGTATIALGVIAANVQAGTLASDVKVSTANISPASAGESSMYLSADGTWSTPAGAGDAVLSSTQTWTGTNTFTNPINISSNVVINGYTVLGSSSSAMKFITLSGTTNAAEGGAATITHGLDSTKIISCSVLVDYNGSGAYVPPEYATKTAGYEYSYDISATAVTIHNHATNSENILSKSIIVTTIYIE